MYLTILTVQQLKLADQLIARSLLSTADWGSLPGTRYASRTLRHLMVPVRRSSQLHRHTHMDRHLPDRRKGSSHATHQLDPHCK